MNTAIMNPALTVIDIETKSTLSTKVDLKESFCRFENQLATVDKKLIKVRGRSPLSPLEHNKTSFQMTYLKFEVDFQPNKIKLSTKLCHYKTLDMDMTFRLNYLLAQLRKNDLPDAEFCLVEQNDDTDDICLMAHMDYDFLEADNFILFDAFIRQFHRAVYARRTRANDILYGKIEVPKQGASGESNSSHNSLRRGSNGSHNSARKGSHGSGSRGRRPQQRRQSRPSSSSPRRPSFTQKLFSGPFTKSATTEPAASRKGKALRRHSID